MMIELNEKGYKRKKKKERGCTDFETKPKCEKKRCRMSRRIEGVQLRV